MPPDDTALGESAEPHLGTDLLEVTVPAGPAAPAAARRALTTWLSARAADAVLNDAPLVVSELVTNSLLHADLRGPATVRVSAQLAEGVLRLEVEDAGTAGTVAQRDPSDDRRGGYGLNIVDALAARWGVVRDGGTLVWAELATARETC
jgi:anti-sigma regulatory factor (Ser/Thr protein kinase)